MSKPATTLELSVFKKQLADSLERTPTILKEFSEALSVEVERMSG